MTEVAPMIYASYAGSLTILLTQTLSGLQDLKTPTSYYILKTMKNLIPLIEKNESVSTMGDISVCTKISYLEASLLKNTISDGKHLHYNDATCDGRYSSPC